MYTSVWPAASFACVPCRITAIPGALLHTQSCSQATAQVAKDFLLEAAAQQAACMWGLLFAVPPDPQCTAATGTSETLAGALLIVLNCCRCCRCSHSSRTVGKAVRWQRQQQQQWQASWHLHRLCWLGCFAGRLRRCLWHCHRVL